MPAPTGSIIDLYDPAIEQKISESVQYWTTRLDDLIGEIPLSSENVAKSTYPLSKDYEYYRTFYVPSGGVVHGGEPYGDAGLFGDVGGNSGDPRFSNPAISEVYPDPDEQLNSLPMVMKGGLKGIRTNLKMTRAEMRMEATPAFTGKILAPRYSQFGRDIAHHVLTYAYLNQNVGYILARISGTPTVSGTGPYYITFTVHNNALARFRPNQAVDIYSTTAGALTSASVRRNDTAAAIANQSKFTRQNVWVHSVNYLKNELKLITWLNPATVNASNFNGGAPIDTDAIMPAQSRITGTTLTGTSSGWKGFHGFNSYMKFGTGGDDNVLLGAEAIGTDATNGKIDVTSNPEFGSLLKAVGGVMTEALLRRVTAAFIDMKFNEAGQLTDYVGSSGVWRAYEETKIGREIIDRTMRLSSMQKEGSEEGMFFTHEGKKIRLRTSRYVESGSVYGHDFSPGNWAMLAPPKVQGEVGDSNIPIPLPFSFLGSTTGNNGKWFPVYRSVNTPGNSRVTDAAQAPGDMYAQFCPKRQVFGVKLTGCTESRILSTDTAYSS